MRELGFDDVLFKMDAKLVVDSLESTMEDRTDFGSENVGMFFSFLKNSSVEFARRYTNMNAHTLNKVAVYNANPRLFFFFNFLTCIEALIFIYEMNCIL